MNSLIIPIEKIKKGVNLTVYQKVIGKLSLEDNEPVLRSISKENYSVRYLRREHEVEILEIKRTDPVIFHVPREQGSGVSMRNNNGTKYHFK